VTQFSNERDQLTIRLQSHEPVEFVTVRTPDNIVVNRPPQT